MDLTLILIVIASLLVIAVAAFLLVRNFKRRPPQSNDTLGQEYDDFSDKTPPAVGVAPVLNSAQDSHEAPLIAPSNTPLGSGIIGPDQTEAAQLAKPIVMDTVETLVTQPQAETGTPLTTPRKP